MRYVLLFGFIIAVAAFATAEVLQRHVHEARARHEATIMMVGGER